MLTDQITLSRTGFEALIATARREAFVEGRVSDQPMLPSDREKYPGLVEVVEAMHREKAERDAAKLYPMPGESVGERTQGEAAA